MTLFVDRLKKKTVKALVRHIIEALLTADGSFCEPLSLDYLKTLRALLDYNPHVEHFDKALWTEVAGFCVESVAAPDVWEENLINDGVPSRTQSTPFRTQASLLWKDAKAGSIENVVELLGCLCSLVRAPNAPVSSQAKVILWRTLQFLKVCSSVTAGHHSAIQTINSLLDYVTLNANSIISSMTLDILIVIKTLWPRTRTEQLLADEMLICLLHLQAYLKSIKKNKHAEKYVPEMEALLRVMQSEYCSHREEKRGHLELSDLGLHSVRSPRFGTNPMQLSSCHLRRCNAKSERNWTELQCISFLIDWLDSCLSNSQQHHSDVDFHLAPSKRIRRMLKIEGLMEQMNTKSTLTRTCLVQISAFVLDHCSLDVRQSKTMLEQLLDSVSNSDAELASWSFFAIAW